MSKPKVIIIGAGASGMMAAGRAAESGASVILLEKTAEPGKKILISGKTHCNLTNTRELEDFILMYGPNGRFLYGAFHKFFRTELLEFLKQYGIETKVERGGRIFPVSDNARDVVDAFKKYLTDNSVRTLTLMPASHIVIENGKVIGVRSGATTHAADAVILATGGSSFPETGSSGDGYRMAAEVGHTVIKLRPGLVPLVVNEIDRAASMQGVSLKNVRLTAFACPSDNIDAALTPKKDAGRGIPGKSPKPPVIESRLGEMMMTHFGIGGPVTLQMSLAIVNALGNGPVSVSIDFKPALSIEQLNDRLQRDFDAHGKSALRSILKESLPQKLIDPYIELSGIPSDRRGHEISSAEREKLTGLLKSLRFNIKQPLPMTSAMVTAGGVSLKEIDPQTMESKLVRKLYFCGEVMDIDAETGGYNLQAAFSTGFIAGENAAKQAK